MSIYDNWAWKELTHWRISDDGYDKGIDWCEPNWVITPYIGEFFNSISILPTLVCFSALMINIYHFKDVIETRYYVWLFAYMGSAMGGIIAHGSLLHFFGIIDEMILFANGLMFIFILTNTWNVDKIHKLWYIWMNIAVVIWFFCLELIPIPGFIITVAGQFGVGVIQIWFLWKLFKTKMLFTIPNLLRYYIIGFIMYAIAGTFAMLDVLLCPMMNYSILHAIWHVMIGILSQLLFVLVLKIRLYVLNRHDEITQIKYFPFFFKRIEIETNGGSDDSINDIVEC
eukprot:211636_1